MQENKNKSEHLERREEISINHIFGALRKYVWLVILITLIGTIIGGVYSYKNSKNMYTATTSVILITNILDENGDSQSAFNDINLAKISLRKVLTDSSSPLFLQKANVIYHEEMGKTEGDIAASGFSIREEENSLICYFSYVDVTKSAACDKLEAVIQSINENLPEVTLGDFVKLQKTQNNFSTYSSRTSKQSIFVGFVGGLVVSVIFVLVVILLDKTIKTREELEEITKTEVIAFIDK